MNLIYCDYIAFKIRDLLRAGLPTDEILAEVGAIHFDLHANGWWLSPKKTLHVTDKNGTEYLITVEDMPKTTTGEFFATNYKSSKLLADILK